MERPVAPVVVRSIEPINLQEFLARYARAIVEAHGARPSSTEPELVVQSSASTPAA